MKALDTRQLVEWLEPFNNTGIEGSIEVWELEHAASTQAIPTTT